jgi:hypothetical protein
MNKENFKRYAELKTQAKQIEEEMKLLQPAIIADMEAESSDKVQTPVGNFTFVSRKTWKYTSAVKEAADVVEKLKLEEQQSGRATFDEQRTLMFTALKPEKQEE